MRSSEFLNEASLPALTATKSITVKRGDTLSQIAQNNSTTVAAIMKINDIANPNLIHPGDVIRIPSTGTGEIAPVVKKKPRSEIVTATSNAKTAMDFFIQQGWTPEQAAGIVANLQAESYDRIDPAAIGDRGRAYGIAQWRGPRQQQFEKIAGKPLKGSSLEDQLNFVNWELHNTESSAGKRLKQATTAAEAAAVIDQYYERSSGIHRANRIASAKALLPTVA